MTALAASGSERRSGARTELAKIAAFARRDFLVAWSYRSQFFGDAANLVLQVFLFYLVGRLVDPARLPEFNGQKSTYLEFVSVGIALSAFVMLGLHRIAEAFRREQMIGTLEALLLTPTSPATIQIGSVAYDLLYIPIRTGVFLAIVAFSFGLHFHADGFMPAALVLVAFIPFVWGLGIVGAAATLTFKRGAGGVGLAMTVLTLGSGAYFPLTLLPDWLEPIASFNPIAIAISGMRAAVIGGGGWSTLTLDQLMLLPVSLACLGAGVVAFRIAVAREQRRGTLAMY
jgi:ABC-2 type transport system permease protein